MARTVFIKMHPAVKNKIKQLDELTRSKVRTVESAIENGIVPLNADDYHLAVFGTDLILVCESISENYVQIVEILELKKKSH